MKHLRRILMFLAALAALSYAFYRFAPNEAAAAGDEATMISVLTDDGVRRVSMAEYLPGVVAAEMPVCFGQEALRAQAVAARTYILAGRRHEDADVCTSGGCCLAHMSEAELRAFWGEDYEKHRAAVEAAVAATDGQYLAWEGRPAETVFHASSAGATEEAAAVWSARPYLVSVDTPETPALVSGLVTVSRFSPDELRAALSLAPDGEPSAWLGAETRDAAGRLADLTIAGRSFSGTELRALLSLRSTDIEAGFDGADFVFTVSGSGHGVGMSQYGARLLAAQGLGYEAILAHYYPGTELVGRRP